MPVLSVLRSLPIKNVLCKPNGWIIESLQKRNGHNKMYITPSRWQWHKFKDMFHFYFMLGFVPLSALVFAVNVFIGPAQLTAIPDDYVPKEYEYHKHPICRWYSKYIYESHQQEYEKLAHWYYEEREKKEMAIIEKKVYKIMKERGDSKAYFYEPVVGEYVRRVRKEYDEQREFSGYS